MDYIFGTINTRIMDTAIVCNVSMVWYGTVAPVAALNRDIVLESLQEL